MSTFKKEKAPLKPTRKARNELTEEQKQEIKEAFDLLLSNSGCIICLISICE